METRGVPTLITEKLTHDMRVLFIGYNPSPLSDERGLNYAGRNNRFYPILFQSGLTERQYTPEESPQLLDDYGYGFTNLVARPTQRADELSKEEYAEGRQILHQKLDLYRPLYACYVGKGVYEQFALPKKNVPWGFRPQDVVPGVHDFVAPSSSGLVRIKMSEIVEIYAQLAKRLQQDLSK
jgi:double-stranded uracil-DNA glycosylase